MNGGKVSVISREWLTLDEATAELGKSPKTVERLVTAELLRSRLEARGGRKPQRLYHAEDIERIRTEAIAAPAAQSTRAIAPAPPTQLAIAPDTVTTLRDVMAEWLNGRERVSLREKFWLSIDEAAALSGLGKTHLRRLCREGELVSVRAPGLRIRRASLEEYAG